MCFFVHLCCVSVGVFFPSSAPSAEQSELKMQRCLLLRMDWFCLFSFSSLVINTNPLRQTGAHTTTQRRRTINAQPNFPCFFHSPRPHTAYCYRVYFVCRVAASLHLQHQKEKKMYTANAERQPTTPPTNGRADVYADGVAVESLLFLACRVFFLSLLHSTNT